MPRYKLRTLLIVLALGPMVLAGTYWAWPFRGRWRIHDGNIIYLTDNTPGYHWELKADGGILEVPNDDPRLPVADGELGYMPPSLVRPLTASNGFFPPAMPRDE